MSRACIFHNERVTVCLKVNGAASVTQVLKQHMRRGKGGVSTQIYRR